jgi:ribonucleoside-triphosphate reductase (thioredoxin)
MHKCPCVCVCVRVCDFSAAQGWVDSLRELLNVYLHPHAAHRRPPPSFDYSLVRPAGEPIKGFGGTSQGAV